MYENVGDIEDDSSNQEVRDEAVADQVDHSLDVVSNIITSGILDKENLDQNVSSVSPENFKSDKGVQDVSEASSDENRNADDPTSAADTSRDNIPISKLKYKKTKSVKGVDAISLKPSDVSEELDFEWDNVKTDQSVSENDNNNTLRSQNNLFVKPGKKKPPSKLVLIVPFDGISFHSMENAKMWKFVVNMPIIVERDLSKQT